jgi:hypothetical protein
LADSSAAKIVLEKNINPKKKNIKVKILILPFINFRLRFKSAQN